MENMEEKLVQTALAYNFIRINAQAGWNNDNGVYCEKCNIQLNENDNPHLGLGYKKPIRNQNDDGYNDNMVQCDKCMYYH
jgi:hypothetical protein